VNATPLNPQDEGPLLLLIGRAAIGGTLMGLANLVPGVSGGTMLLAAGVYPAFVEAIAELTTFRFRQRSLLLLAAVAGAAGLAILALAGATRSLVIDHRWVMYSLFIGLTLGGVPLVWRLARPATPALWVGTAAGFSGMLWMALAPDAGPGGGEASTGLLLLSGTAGAGAMILPGLSGGYLLLLLGQYLPILGAVDKLKQVLLSVGGPDGLDTQLLGEALSVAVPVGIGVVVGIVVISNLVRFALERFPKATLGVLLGLLLGAVVGLWPFQHGVPPKPGDVIRGRAVTAAEIAEIKPERWALQRFTPTPGQAGASLGLVLLGLLATLGIDRFGSDGRGEPAD
jgi:putative membrane protein